jgi:hypothetical protein
MLILAGWTGLSVGFVLGTLWAWVVRKGPTRDSGSRLDERVPSGVLHWRVPTSSTRSTSIGTA